jgi:hypothetical protein
VTLRLTAVLVAGACGHDAQPPVAVAADSNETFVAFPATFQAFRTWPSVHDDGPADDGTFTVDVLGPRTQYLSAPPPHGAKEFPVGTIIVEARESGLKLILAGVKRGGGYNAGGATNWEWFGLAEDPTSHAVSINWRGLAPPVGGYGGIPTGGCNSCHQSCGATNDFVCSPELQLASF